MPSIMTPESPSLLQAAVERIHSRTSEEVARDCARIFSLTSPPRELPADKTFDEIVADSWPGEESDAEVHESLRRLS